MAIINPLNFIRFPVILLQMMIMIIINSAILIF